MDSGTHGASGASAPRHAVVALSIAIARVYHPCTKGSIAPGQPQMRKLAAKTLVPVSSTHSAVVLTAVHIQRECCGHFLHFFLLFIKVNPATRVRTQFPNVFIS